MKRVLFIIIAFSIQLINAQEQDLQRANRLFDKTYYSAAIPLYENSIQENHSKEVVKNLADCYFYTNDFNNAQEQYRFLIKNFGKDLGEEYYFRFSQTLKATGNYKEANKVMHDYFSQSTDKQNLVNFEKNGVELENISAIGNRYEINNLAINTPNSEFGAVVLNQDLVFAGVKAKPSLFDKTYKWNDETYLNLVTIPLVNSNSSDSIVNYFSKKVKTSMHESNAVFTKDGKTMYFTRNNYKNGRRGKNKEKVSNIQIFKAEFINDKWSNIKALPFNSEDYSVEHPALSADEKTLYFASDMPGTLGSFDIFSISIDDTAYGTPKNLGDKINTAKREQFPFVSKDNKLYFSSNGHEGYGSLDVFVSEIQNDSFSKASNVGLPVNSGYDDFSFTIDSDSKEGYFSSNRLGGKGNDDIYALKETKPLLIEDCKQFIAGIITDVDSHLAIENAFVVLQNSDRVEIERTTTSPDGKFNFTVVCEKGFILVATKENYTEGTKSLKLKGERNKTNDGSMEIRSFEIIKKEEQIAVEQKKAADLIALDLKKKNDLILFKQNKLAEIALIEQAKKDKQVADKKDKEVAVAKKKEKIDDIIANEKDVVKDKDRLIIKTDPIYFDYNMWYIRKDSKTILNRVVELMKKYPGMVVEIGSHTDNRGNDKFNRDLSQKRADATRTYILEQGIPKNRISAKGYGESVQIVKCVPEDSCDEEQHELNRRSEFVIQSL